MFSYRHSFHAGNHADVLKHMSVVAILRYLTRAKETPLLLVDTHAGAGLYRLDGAEAQTSQEAAAAILPLWRQYGPGAPEAEQAPEALAAYLQVLADFNGAGGLRKYPGSPLIAADLMREQDQLRVFELHPTDSRLLHKQMAEWQGAQSGPAARVQVVRNNGFTGLKALLPPPSRRALVLMDPSYELKSDYGQVISCMQDALQRFATGCYLVWYPIIARPEAHDLPRRLKTLAQKAGRGWLHATLSVGRSSTGDARGLRASGIFVINPPFVLQAQLQEALPVVCQALQQEAGHGWRVESSA
ncbi:MAG: 23S rRNA (adenine(2030)-N(6))-methyltransferase RlmJ [Brachymonas sp.]|nr:23S rRNA (adenine(2030)-N(6))-methyltransferase RlmJ [Brachymonas sp.]